MLVLWSAWSEFKELNKEIAGVLEVRDAAKGHLDTVYIFKLHRPMCAHANVIAFSIGIESILNILALSMFLRMR